MSAEALDIVLGRGDHAPGLPDEEVRAIADKVMGLGPEDARNVDAVIDFLARGS